MTDSFDFGEAKPYQPLAHRLRPQSLDEYIGQQHILGKDKPLYRALKAGQAHSMILWGPPGSGKTTLAELIALYCDAHVERISAVSGGVKDIRDAIATAHEKARNESRKTLLFVDEVHRFNKAQQDAFLPYIEDGTVIFVGATTENPAFELNRALLSRARVYRLNTLGLDDLSVVLQRALADKDRGLGARKLRLSQDAMEQLLHSASGDARRLLNTLEIAADFCEKSHIDMRVLRQALGDKVAAYDKGGDIYYDMISAFHKSVRGSSVDGALYWYARILVAGGDPLYVARRLLAIASEDIGNADPRALQITLNAWDIFHRVGPSEGERAIAQAAIYCASAAKSNAVYKAFNRAVKEARDGEDYPVPDHLCNAPTALHKDMGKGTGYRYAHDHPNAYAAGETYLPQALGRRDYYQPSERGLEKKIKQKLDWLDGLDKASPWQRWEQQQ